MSSFTITRIALAVALAACNSASTGTVDAPSGSHRDGPPGTGDAPAGTHDGPSSTPDGQNVADGTPTRQPCTTSFGNAIGSNFGRLDGYLVAIIQPNSGQCNSDSGHVHLQVQANGMIYDVAVNVGTTSQADVHTETKDLAFPPWSEGWHDGDNNDYVSLGVHSTDAPAGSPSANTTALDNDLSNVNHISVWATPYSSSGIHDTHRSNTSPGTADGMVVTQPLSSPAHARFFWFSSQTF